MTYDYDGDEPVVWDDEPEGDPYTVDEELAWLVMVDESGPGEPTV